jgi:hypothetical protein
VPATLPVLIRPDKRSSRRVVSRRSRRSPLQGIHPGLEVDPPLLGGLDVRLGDVSGVLAERVQQDDQVPRAPVEDPIQLAPEVAPQLPQLASPQNVGSPSDAEAVRTFHLHDPSRRLSSLSSGFGRGTDQRAQTKCAADDVRSRPGPRLLPKPLIRSLTAQSSVWAVEVVEVLPLLEPLVEQLGVVDHDPRASGRTPRRRSGGTARPCRSAAGSPA